MAIRQPKRRIAMLQACFRFKAKVSDLDLAPIKIRFEASSKSNTQMSDAVEITLPVQPPTIVRKESVAGAFNGPQFDARSKMPETWKHGRGKLNTTISSSPWLPKIAGLPVILEYPHGCFEQISTKLLGYSLLANLLAYLPDLAATRRRVSRDFGARNETILRFAVGGRNAAVLAGRDSR